MSKQEFFEKLRLLKRNEYAVEKDVSGFLHKSDQHNYSYKSKFSETLTIHLKEQQDELRRFQKDLQKADDTIDMFKNKLLQPKPDKIQHIKKLMESIELQMLTIKEYQKSVYDSLMVSESALTTELSIFDNEIHKYERAITTNPRYNSAKSRVQASNQHNLHPAIVEFDKFHSNHGPTNGWGEFEFQIFLKTYNSSLCDSEMLLKLGQSLPFKSEDQIQNQISWYRKFESLEKAKRDALEEWRTAKNKRLAQSKQTSDNSLTLEKMRAKKTSLVERERQERLAHLNAYKAQKELERVMAEEEALKLKIIEEEKEAKRQNYILKQKEKVQAYREKMKLEEEIKAAEEHDRLLNERAHTSVTSSDLMKLHGKNMKVIEKKQLQKQEKIIAQFEQQQRLEKMKPKVHAKRDPSRLLQKTQGQINREKDKSTVNPVVGSRGMPHKAMPAWRKGI